MYLFCYDGAVLEHDPLVDLRPLIPDALFDIRYATPRNLAGRALYARPAAYLRRSAAEKVAAAAAALRRDGLRLVVWDAYRPLSAQRALWAAKPDPRYVADPAKGSSHNKGAAVDLALADSGGAPLAMPTDFDDFSPAARHGAPGVDAGRRRNAERLRAAMTGAGLADYSEEWWHYKDPASAAWPALDVPLEELS